MAITLVFRNLHRRWLLAFALVAGCTLFVLVPLVAGFGKAYRLRYQLDQRQLAALARAVPDLPEGRVILLPVDMDERYLSTIDPALGSCRELFLRGVFQTPRSAASSVRMLYGKPDITAVVSPSWTKPTIDRVEGQSDAAQLIMAGRSIPAGRSLAFGYQDGQPVLCDHIIAAFPDGQHTRIELPLPRQFAAPGMPFQEINLEVSEKPE